MTQTDQQITLSGRRRLGYNIYGAPQGKPVFYFHGTPGSRIEWFMFGSEALAHLMNVRVVAIDRPGIGLSDFQRHRTLADWPADVVAVADKLEIERFAVLGYSGGGPHAVACALAIPERLTTVGLVSSIAPLDVPGLSDDLPWDLRIYLTSALTSPWINRFTNRLAGGITPRLFHALAAAWLPPPDREVYRRSPIQVAVDAKFRESLRRGAHGIQVDLQLQALPWGFDPGNVTTPVHVWQGGLDKNVPASMGRYLAEAIPGSRLHFYPREGHLSLINKHIRDILITLSGQSPRRLLLGSDHPESGRAASDGSGDAPTESETSRAEGNP